ncbi:hypothetical protein POTOM_038236 [Populus tomentosa]|uniref:Uncharacterized protein n=1 Tax=Populus tomentosa TaxID=118781 RepID=A0A8X7YYZ0_POPTO|nr:hypothetical protein POTOM_038236 [Populus tomentosa]
MPYFQGDFQNPKKSLDGAFRSTTEYVSPKINNESYDLSPVSEISDANHFCQTAIISTITDESASVSADCCGLNKASISKIGQVERLEANIMVILLKED